MIIDKKEKEKLRIISFAVFFIDLMFSIAFSLALDFVIIFNTAGQKTVFKTDNCWYPLVFSIIWTILTITLLFKTALGTYYSYQETEPEYKLSAEGITSNV